MNHISLKLRRQRHDFVSPKSALSIITVLSTSLKFISVSNLPNMEPNGRNQQFPVNQENFIQLHVEIQDRRNISAVYFHYVQVQYLGNGQWERGMHSFQKYIYLWALRGVPPL